MFLICSSQQLRHLYSVLQALKSHNHSFFQLNLWAFEEYKLQVKMT